MNGFVNVTQGALLEALGKCIVFFSFDVLVSFLEKLLGAVEAAGVVETSVDRWMIVEVLAIVDCGFLNFRDGIVNGVNGFLLLVPEFAAVMTLEMSASVAKIRQRVKISGMFPLR